VFKGDERARKADESVNPIGDRHSDQIAKNPFSGKRDSSVKKKKEEELKERRRERDEGSEEREMERVVCEEMFSEAGQTQGRERIIEGVKAHRIVGEEIDDRARECGEPNGFCRRARKDC
jgi:hypothetical protein